MRLFAGKNKDAAMPAPGRGLAIVHLNAPELSRITFKHPEEPPLDNIHKVKRSVPGLLLLGLLLPLFVIGLVVVDSTANLTAKADAPTDNPVITDQIPSSNSEVAGVAARPASNEAVPGQPEVTAVPQKTFNYTISYQVNEPSLYSEFEKTTDETLGDAKGWLKAGLGFKKVDSLADFQIVLAEAELLPAFSELCSTEYSCRVGNQVIINAKYWLNSRPELGVNAEDYRRMVVNHEVGHWLGLDHVECPGSGQPAPLMQQQSFGLRGCIANAWPLEAEVNLVKTLQGTLQ